MLRRLILVLAAAGVAGAAPAGGAWSRVPVPGGDITSLAVDSRSGVVYCGTSRGNVYASRDGGRAWTPTRTGNAFPGYVVSALVPDARAAGRLWAALAGADRGSLVAVSPDEGASWSIVARWPRAVDARALAQSRVDPRRLACGGDEGVFVSEDGGRTWRASGKGVDGLALVQSLAFDPAEPGTLYAGTFRQAFRTTDGGRTWSRIADGMVLDATVYDFDFAPSDPARVWVSTCGWVYSSPDRGEHWTRFTEGFTNRRAPAIRIDPTRPSRLYAGTVGGLHRSEDGGRTWRRVSRDTLDVSALAVEPASGRLLVGTLGEGMFYSDDRGDTLVPASSGIDEARVSAVAADPTDPSRVLFLRAYGGVSSGVWEARRGDSRQISSDSPPGAFALAAGRVIGGTLWMCASASVLLVSSDGGETFHEPRRGPPGRVVRLLGEPLARPVVVTDEGVYATRDGETFSRVAAIAGSPVDARVLQSPGGEPELEVITSAGVFRGLGSEFTRSDRPMLSGGLFLQESPDRRDPYFRFQAAGDTLFLSRGNRKAELPLPRPEISVSDAAIAGDGSLYLATMGDGLFRYVPGGAGGSAGSSASSGAGFR
jgi:photosystem II stability/assembly factor-like uncharacterized protein